MGYARGFFVGRLWSAFSMLFVVLMALAVSSDLLAKDREPDLYKDTPQSHRRFSDSLEFFNSPSEFEGYTKETLRAEFAHHRDVLTNYRFEEVAEKVKMALLNEVINLDKLRKEGTLKFDDINFWFFEDSFKVLAAVGNVSDVSELDLVINEFNESIKYLNEQHKQMNVDLKNQGQPAKMIDAQVKSGLQQYAKLGQALKNTLSHREERRASAFDKEKRLQLALGKDFLEGPNPDEMIAKVRLSNYESAKHRGIDWVNDVRERMEKRAKGQPEAIEAFLRFEFQRVMKPERKVPEVIWMLGLPGTGKDTHAEAYVDAIHGVEGAYEEHMKVLEPAQDKTDVWHLFGSKPGHVGSDKQSELIRFLVNHSGGRYKIEEVVSFNSKVERVVETGIVTAENGPSSGVLFINELHNWSKKAIDLILKKSIEKGTFPINNANGGVSFIKVPITIVIASNDGMELLVPEGHTKGRKLTYQEVYDLWKANHNDFERIRDSIKSKNTFKLGEKFDADTGISPEVLDRIRNSGLVLLRPLSSEIILSIAQQRLEKLALDYRESGRVLGHTSFSFSGEVGRRLQEFQFNPEAGARFLDGSVVSLVESVIDSAIINKSISNSDEPRNILVDVITNPDDTWSLKLSFRSPDTNAVLADDLILPISATDVLAKKKPMSDDSILKLLEFEKHFSENIVGADHLAKKLQEALLAAQNSRHAGKEDRAQAFMFLGMSSTGKSQAAKEVARFLHGSESDLITIDFNGLVSEAQVRDLIFGSKHGMPSEFMKAFDRKQGKVVFLFDEIANVDNPNILTPLYQLLREKSIDLFNDGRPRSMEGVTIIMTGNAGEEIYQGIPKGVPERVRRAAAAEIYTSFVNSPIRQRAFLEARFREAFLNRVGYDNTFFFSPLDFTAVRELIRIKLSAALKDLSDKNGRNYHVEFASDEALEKFLDVYEKEGFYFKSQGQSIDDFAAKQLRHKLTLLLQKNLVPSESKVILSYSNRSQAGEGSDARYFENFSVEVEGFDKKLNLQLDGRIIEVEPKERYQDKIQTAFHEAGHEILRQALRQDLTKPKRISIIPGVSLIAGEYVYYEGIASQEHHTSGNLTRTSLIAEMAELIAGGEAQRLISKGHIAEGGQRNDLERANYLAKTAILKYGLDPEWGFSAPTSNQTMKEFISELSERDTIRLEKLVQGYMKEATQLARDVLAINYNAFVALGVELAKKGEIDGKQILAVYEKHPVKNYWKMGSIERKLRSSTNLSYFKTWLQGALPYSGRDLVAVSAVPKIAESEVANIDEILEVRRSEGVKKARPLGTLPVQGKSKVSGCEALLAQVS
jgi:hypothetical protein